MSQIENGKAQRGAGKTEAHKRALVSAGKIVAGNLFITSAYAFITVPDHIVNGGVTSFAMVLENFVPISISAIANIITVLLLIVSFFFLGKEFLMKSLLSSFCYMGFFSGFSALAANFQLPLILPVAVVLASVMIGFGYYLCINAGSSAVGFDVLALAAHKRNPRIDVALTIRYINYGVLLLGIVVYGVWAILVGIVFTYLKTALLRQLLKRDDQRELEKREASDKLYPAEAELTP